MRLRVVLLLIDRACIEGAGGIERMYYVYYVSALVGAGARNLIDYNLLAAPLYTSLSFCLATAGWWAVRA